MDQEFSDEDMAAVGRALISLTADGWADQIDQMSARQTASNPLREIKRVLTKKTKPQEKGDGNG